jgi:hypothetical protein
MVFMCGALLAAPASAAGARSAAKTKPGVISICKSAKNGMTAKSSFALNGGTPFKLAGGACSAPLATHSGPNTVVESPGTGVDVAKITANDVVSKNLATGTVVVDVDHDRAVGLHRGLQAGRRPVRDRVVRFHDHGSRILHDAQRARRAVHAADPGPGRRRRRRGDATLPVQRERHRGGAREPAGVGERVERDGHGCRAGR